MLPGIIAAHTMIRNNRRRTVGLGYSQIGQEKIKVKMEREAVKNFSSMVSSDSFRHNDARTFSISNEVEKKPIYFLSCEKTFITIYLSDVECLRYIITKTISPITLGTNWSVQEQFQGKDKYYSHEDAFALMQLLSNNCPELDISEAQNKYQAVYNFKDSRWKV